MIADEWVTSIPWFSSETGMDVLQTLTDDQFDRVISPFNWSSPGDTRVIIIGDYDTTGDVGYAYGSPVITSAIENIAREVELDCGLPISSTDLKPWVNQGVLLLNRTMVPGTTTDLWKPFFISLLQTVNKFPQNIVVMLWGEQPKDLWQYVSSSHGLLDGPGPESPKFSGCRYFSKTNTYLRAHKQPLVDWAA